MRSWGVAIVVVMAWSCSALAGEHSAANDVARPVLTEHSTSKSYPLEWQRRLLAAQVAFAESLTKVDPVETGSITPATR